MNQVLQRLVLEAFEGCSGPVLELYAGAGNLTVPLVRAGLSVTAVEQVDALATAGEANVQSVPAAPTLGEGSFLKGDAGALPSKVVKALKRGHYHGLLLDPPREGAAAALKAISLQSVGRVVVVSCNPETLGRDIGLLSDAGFRVTHAAALDMFPHTSHVEAVLRLDREPTGRLFGPPAR